MAMSKFLLKIEVEAQSPEQVQEIGNLVQFAVANVQRDDLLKLLRAVKKNPGIVKRAVMFI